MRARAAVWKISRDVFESMLRMWFKSTRCQGDPTDLRLVDIGSTGRNIVVMVELVDGLPDDASVKKYIDRLIEGA
jgi:hypothetical protein